MYTVFKPYCKYIKGEGYAKGFVSCNARGTNNFTMKQNLQNSQKSANYPYLVQKG